MSRINHNIPAMITQSSLAQVGRDLSKSLEKLSSGLRINRASDDAAGLSVSESLRTQVRGLAMNKRNAQDGISLLNVAEGAMNEISAMLQRMRELCVQGDNDTLTSKERLYLNLEFQHLMQETDRIVDSSKFNGMTLLDGTWDGTVAANPSILHIGPNNTAGVDTLVVTIAAVSTIGLGINGTSITDRVNINLTFPLIDLAIDTVNRVRANLGAFTNRLEHTLISIENQHSNMQAAESVIRDTDFAEETTNFTRNQIISQSATAMLAQANSIPQSILQLLQG